MRLASALVGILPVALLLAQDSTQPNVSITPRVREKTP